MKEMMIQSYKDYGRRISHLSSILRNNQTFYDRIREGNLIFCPSHPKNSPNSFSWQTVSDPKKPNPTKVTSAKRVLYKLFYFVYRSVTEPYYFQYILSLGNIKYILHRQFRPKLKIKKFASVFFWKISTKLLNSGLHHK